jgi:1-acyl-sn-glycerol-3-phosphate acyltransferase
VVLGRENLPATGPIIFSPNHQNALMDALAIVCTVRCQTVFLARADLFEKPLVARVLAFFKIMPVYRLRDGYATLAKNNGCYAAAAAVLNAGQTLCLMPEGNHGDRRTLRPFSKGLFRIALGAQRTKGVEPFVRIVPVGLDHSDYSGFRARLIIRFGPPIEVSEFFPAYAANPAKAFHALGDRLRAGMKRLMLHVESSGHYDAIWTLKDAYRERMANRLQLGTTNAQAMFSIDQRLLRLLDEAVTRDDSRLAEVEPALSGYRELLSDLRLRPENLGADVETFAVLARRSVLHLCALPVLVYAFLNSAISCWVAVRLSRAVEDPQFRSSLQFVAGVFLVPVIGLLQTLLVFEGCHSAALSALYFVSIYAGGAFGFDLFVAARTHVRSVRYRWAVRNRKARYLELERVHEALVGFMDTLTAGDMAGSCGDKRSAVASEQAVVGRT